MVMKVGIETATQAAEGTIASVVAEKTGIAGRISAMATSAWTGISSNAFVQSAVSRVFGLFGHVASISATVWKEAVVPTFKTVVAKSKTL